MINNKLREVLSVLLCSVLIINTGFCTFAAAKNNDEVAEIGAAMTELPDRETRQENIQEIHNETIEQSECETVLRQSTRNQSLIVKPPRKRLPLRKPFGKLLRVKPGRAYCRRLRRY